MSIRTSTITTAEQLLNAPSDLGRCELVRGELVMMSPAILAEGDTLTEEELLPGFSLVVNEVFPPA